MTFSIDMLLQHKFMLLLIIFCFALLTFILGIARISLPGTVIARSNVWVIVVCLKSMVVMTYEVVTQRLARFQRWASLKANAILGVLEPVFWFTAFILSCMGVSGRCQGGGCALGVILVLLALVLSALTLCLAIMSVQEYRHFKADRRHAGPTKTTSAFNHSAA